MKRQGKAPEKQLSEVKIGNLPETEFGVMITKIIQDLWKECRQRLGKCRKFLPKT